MTETWNESTPASSESPTLGDDRIRSLKTAIRERLAVDHDFEASESPAFGGSGSTIGNHEGIRLKEQSSSPTTLTNMGAIWAADDGGGNTELFMRGPSDATAYQLTEGNCQYLRKEVVEILKDLTATYGEINQLAGNTFGGTSTGDVVTIDDTQTLTNKTLTTPTVNGSQLDATGDEIDAAADGIGVVGGPPRLKTIQIGDWNMDSTSYVYVAHGLTASKIVGIVSVMIRHDDGSIFYQCPGFESDFSAPTIKAEIISGNVYLVRKTGGVFDSTNFNATSYNRGYIILGYID